MKLLTSSTFLKSTPNYLVNDKYTKAYIMNGTSFFTLIFCILFSLSASNSEISRSNEEQCSEKHNKYSKGK